MDYTEPQIERSALITIDTQNDFTLPGAPAEIPGTRNIIANMRRLLTWSREKQRPIIHIVRIYREDAANVDLCRKRSVEAGKAIVSPGSDGAELVNALKPDANLSLDAPRLLAGKIQNWSENEVVMYKPRWGAFYQTPLAAYLQARNINTLVFTGCNFPNCPRTSLYEASERDFKLVLIRDAVSGLYDRGIREMESIGVRVVDTANFIYRRSGKIIRNRRQN